MQIGLTDNIFLEGFQQQLGYIRLLGDIVITGSEMLVPQSNSLVATRRNDQGINVRNYAFSQVVSMISPEGLFQLCNM